QTKLSEPAGQVLDAAAQARTSEAPPTPAMDGVVPKTEDSRRLPAVLALVLVMLAATATALAYRLAHAPDSSPEAAWVVPLPPERSGGPPPRLPQGVETVASPIPDGPSVGPTPTPAPTPERPATKPVPAALAKHPATTHVQRLQTAMSASKGSVVVRALP